MIVVSAAPIKVGRRSHDGGIVAPKSLIPMKIHILYTKAVASLFTKSDRDITSFSTLSVRRA